eukprot:m.171103 g.171103  ORF g.171103 m.171103 type:complete len:166 (-) comp14547_c2_seq4:1515-2012(-)
MLYLTLECLYTTPSTAMDHVASHIGRAEGLVAMLRGILPMAKAKKLVLPLDITTSCLVVQQDVIEGKVTPALRDAVHEVASQATRHINSATHLYEEALANPTAKDTDPERVRAAAAVFLPAISVKRILDILLEVDFDPFNPALHAPLPPSHAMKVWWKARKHQFY